MKLPCGIPALPGSYSSRSRSCSGGLQSHLARSCSSTAARGHPPSLYHPPAPVPLSLPPLSAACSAEHPQCPPHRVGLMDCHLCNPWSNIAAFILQQSMQRAGGDTGRRWQLAHSLTAQVKDGILQKMARLENSENQTLGENLLRRQCIHFCS